MRRRRKRRWPGGGSGEFHHLCGALHARVRGCHRDIVSVCQPHTLAPHHSEPAPFLEPGTQHEPTSSSKSVTVGGWHCGCDSSRASAAVWAEACGPPEEGEAVGLRRCSGTLPGVVGEASASCASCSSSSATRRTALAAACRNALRLVAMVAARSDKAPLSFERRRLLRLYMTHDGERWWREA
jgi:hypothetical protein